MEEHCGAASDPATASGATPPADIPGLPKLQRSALIRPQATGSLSDVFVFAWPKRQRPPLSRIMLARGRRFASSTHRA
jgi:hypothetical protein